MMNKLNRLRLRLGLFRWKNYASIEPVYPNATSVVASAPNGDVYDIVALTAAFWVLYWVVYWPHPRALSDYPDGKFPSHRDAIRYVRRCIRRGERP
jgi:hypothetical protein